MMQHFCIHIFFEIDNAHKHLRYFLNVETKFNLFYFFCHCCFAYEQLLSMMLISPSKPDKHTYFSKENI